MSGRTRASLAALLALLAACAAPAAAQARACPADDGARAGWVSSEEVEDEAWLSALVTRSVVTNATEVVRIDEDSAPRTLRRAVLGEPPPNLMDRIGDDPIETVIAARIGRDGRLSTVLVAVPSGLAAYDEWIRRSVTRMRFSPAVEDGCPIVWMAFPLRYQAACRLRHGRRTFDDGAPVRVGWLLTPGRGRPRLSRTHVGTAPHQARRRVVAWGVLHSAGPAEIGWAAGLSRAHDRPDRSAP